MTTYRPFASCILSVLLCLAVTKVGHTQPITVAGQPAQLDMRSAGAISPGATTRNVYLPEVNWYDWWTYEKVRGAQTVTREVDLAIMPIYVRAGAIIPLDPVRQYTSQTVDAPTRFRPDSHRVRSQKKGDFLSNSP